MLPKKYKNGGKKQEYYQGYAGISLVEHACFVVHNNLTDHINEPQNKNENCHININQAIEHSSVRIRIFVLLPIHQTYYSTTQQ